MRSDLLACGVAAALLLSPAICFGHGHPIVVTPSAGKLMVSGGVADDRGSAGWVFAEADEEGNLTPAPGDVLFTTLPGLDVTGMTAGEQISLEALSRPDFTNTATTARWLWYWSAATGTVTDVPNDPALQIDSLRELSPSVVLTQATASENRSVLLAILQDSDLGVHRHMAAYLLDDNPPAEPGVYAFFARLTSPSFGPSEPMLLAFNNGLDAVTFQQGALRINAAARLPGDYDGDEDVDGADLLVWQRTLGSTAALAADGSVNDVVDAADLAVWQANFGRISAALALSAAAVPEPGLVAMLSVVAIAAQRLVRRRVKRPTP
jgi:hypothetical protein